jgi:hypothetical protein
MAQENFAGKVAVVGGKNRDTEIADSHAPPRPASDTKAAVNNL